LKALRRIINIDMDGCVYNFEDAMRAYAGKLLDRELPPWNQWDAWKDWGITPAVWKRIFRSGVDSGEIWGQGAPYPGAFDALWALSDDEWHIRILTTRLVHNFDYAQAVKLTADWLEANGMPYRSLAVIGGEDDTKLHYKAEALVDDKTETVNMWSMIFPGAIILNRPWNLSREAFSTVHRAEGWSDVLSILGVK